MKIKEVYSIRIAKEDGDIKNYLEQFPEHEQSQALKSLLKYGIERLNKDFSFEKTLEQLNETVLRIQEEQQQKLNEIKNLITELKSSDVKVVMSEDQPNENDVVDVKKARDSMQEALQMFLG